MASTLPGPASSECCPAACDEVTSIQVPGPQGTAGAAGTNGTDGDDAYSTLTALFTIPAELATAVATVDSTAWMSINQIVFAARADGSVSGHFQVTVIGGATSVTLKNLEDTASSAYLSNSAPAATITVGGKISPAGLQGPAVTPSGAAGGDLKGTYPNPLIAVNNTKGSLLVGNGTDSVSVPVSATDGHLIRSLAADAEGLDWFKGLPFLADTGSADNRIARLNRPLGTEVPVPMQPSLVTITDTGAIQADGSGGNARGTDAVDLQVNRTNATEVASGAESFIGGGDGNTASGARAVCVGGDANTVSAIEGFVGGGESNQAITGDRAGVCCGQLNVASGTESFIGGGEGNTASASHATVAGGQSNTASQQDCTVGGGQTNTASGNSAATVAGGASNTASAAASTIGGGNANTASAAYATVGGGNTNLASGPSAIIPGGSNAVADKHGQLSHAAGQFAAAGDAQTFELVLRRATADATASELFLDGASLRATIPTNTTWAFHLHTVARDSNAATAESAAWEVKGVISNDNGTTSLVTAVTSVTLADDTGGTWAHAVTADNANDALVITFTGEAGRNIRVVSHIRIVQVTY